MALSEKHNTPNNTMKTNVTRTVIKGYINDLREIRADKRIPCLFGQGHTVALKNGNTAVRIIDRTSGKLDLMGRWNRDTSYWTQDTAHNVMVNLSKQVDLDLEVIHRNDLRDRSEQTALRMIPILWKMRGE